MNNQKLLVSIRGKNEALEAVKGGAHILDVEYPKSALGTPYPLNIINVRTHVPLGLLVSTNIGEKQFVWSTASQAALGVALSGADIIKIGLAELNAAQATEVMERAIRNVKWWFPQKQFIATFFADPELQKYCDVEKNAPLVAAKSKANGVLIDTFDKNQGKDLMDFMTVKEIKKFVVACHKKNLEAWIAGSIKKEQLPNLWNTGVNVICVRGAACEKDGSGRMSKVKASIVKELIATLPIK